MSPRRKPPQPIRYDGPSDEFITGWGLHFTQGQVHELEEEQALELLTYPGHRFVVHVPEPEETEGAPIAQAQPPDQGQAGPAEGEAAPATEAEPPSETGGV
jgi:hypothetical protein